MNDKGLCMVNFGVSAGTHLLACGSGEYDDYQREGEETVGSLETALMNRCRSQDSPYGHLSAERFSCMVYE